MKSLERVVGAIRHIQVVCPGGMVTGGTESLHMLAARMKQIGISASVVYYPFSRNFDVPDSYRSYNVEVSRYHDCEGQLTIFPEIMVMQALKVRRSVAAIWWLSVDNFLRRKNTSGFLNKLNYLYCVAVRQRPLFIELSLRRLLHFSKSEYDRLFLRSMRIPCYNLTGPIHPDYLSLGCDYSGGRCRSNVILFYPRKGLPTVDRLRHRFPDLEFYPISGMRRSELIQLFSESKLFVDFGHHPGRERMVREAAICGCCVLTNLRGSAHNPVDVPIPSRFKLDESSEDFFSNFYARALEVLSGFERVTQEFAPYRKTIHSDFETLANELAVLRQLICINPQVPS